MLYKILFSAFIFELSDRLNRIFESPMEVSAGKMGNTEKKIGLTLEKALSFSKERRLFLLFLEIIYWDKGGQEQGSSMIAEGIL